MHMLAYVYRVLFSMQSLSVYSIRDFVRVCEELKVAICLSGFLLCISVTLLCLASCSVCYLVLFCLVLLGYRFTCIRLLRLIFYGLFLRLYHRPTDTVNLYAHARATSVLDSSLTVKLLFS